MGAYYHIKRYFYFSFYVINLITLPLTMNAQEIPGPTLLSPPDFMTHITPPVLMDWEDYPGATKYQIQLCMWDPEFSDPEIDKFTFRSELLVDTLIGIHYYEYFWRVRAELNNEEWTSWSETWRFRTFCLVEGPLLIYPADGFVFDTHINDFGWNGVIGSYAYDIWIDDDPELLVPDYMFVVAEPYFEISYLNPGTTYYWKTRAHHVCIERFSDVWSFTTCTPYPASNLISPPDYADHLLSPVKLEWSGSEYSSDFRIQLSKSLDFDDLILDEIVSDTTLTTSLLEDGVTFFWRVHIMADDPCGYENWSNINQFSTKLIFVCGDVNDDGAINILDIVYLINYKYKGGTAPEPLAAADVNNDVEVDILDIVYLINYKYKSGPEPACPSE